MKSFLIKKDRKVSVSPCVGKWDRRTYGQIFQRVAALLKLTELFVTYFWLVVYSGWKVFLEQST